MKVDLLQYRGRTGPELVRKHCQLATPFSKARTTTPIDIDISLQLKEESYQQKVLISFKLFCCHLHIIYREFYWNVLHSRQIWEFYQKGKYVLSQPGLLQPWNHPFGKQELYSVLTISFTQTEKVLIGKGNGNGKEPLTLDRAGTIQLFKPYFAQREGFAT